MNPFEKRAAGGIDYAKREQGLSPFMEEAHAKAKAVLKNRAQNPASFKGRYDDRLLAEDAQKVGELKRKFEAAENSDVKMARVFEALVCDPATDGWFGRDGRVWKTADYDDFINGVDLILDFGTKNKGRGYLATAVDLTFGPSTIEKKLERIRDSIREKQSAHVRYFAPAGNAEPGLSGLPRAVLGVEYETLAELARLWVTGKSAELHDHPVQRIIAEELYAEMRAYRALARETKEASLVEGYEKAHAFAYDLYNQKSHLRFRNGEDEDRVYAAIKRNIAMP